MKVGDKRQAIILSIVAVLAVAFLFSQLTPKGQQAVATALQTPMPEPTAIVSDNRLPLLLERDAFSHALLALDRKPKPAQPEPNPPSGSSLAAPIRNEMGRLPDVSYSNVGYAPLQPQPAENAGISQQQVQRPTLQLSVQGIVRATRPIAMVSLKGGETISVKQGDKIAKGVTVLKITDDTLVLHTPSGKVSVRVGEVVDL